MNDANIFSSIIQFKILYYFNNMLNAYKYNSAKLSFKILNCIAIRDNTHLKYKHTHSDKKNAHTCILF